MLKFSLESDYSPEGDQPKAIDGLLSGHAKEYKKQTLMGVTGSGKTYTIANVIQKIDKPVLVVAPNKTLTAQLYAEFKELFPENGVGIYLSYYDYYQPESYVATKDLYISKEVSINEEIEKLRHSSLKLLSERDDVIIIATVSCIFGTGPPKNYRDARIILKEGKSSLGREELMLELVRLQYMRNDIDFKPKAFRVRGDIVEINPIWTDEIIRVEFFGDEIDRLSWVDGITGTVIDDTKEVVIYPATQFMTEEQRIESVLQEIEEELTSYHNQLLSENKLVEAQRIQQRIKYDLEMLKEYKYCKGIENYSRYFSSKEPGEAPFTLLDHFPEDFLTIIDESHVTVPQIRGMYKGDRSRKESLVTHGFRLPSALDNRPLTWEEFSNSINETIFMSATPGTYELENSDQIVEQIIRPTGLIDPEIDIYPTAGQIDHLYSEIKKATANDERVIVTTL
ncbi:MAG: DEAD/DEAH box helicase family protein, partial [Candidatus Heimdallarchaeota archaeon]|nr:DEAD/DEAH box helicase family protein [Candidatus Heimdallarchaeota archaeon]MCK5049936.1 DEAD/DEAH box helicase family protein [Candidatus Heimdallarchaeota archaeon]